MPVDDTLPDLTSAWALIESAADRFDGARMLVDDRDRDWTFAQYRDACSRVAARLVADGISTSSTVSWQLPTTIEAVVLLGALARLGVRQNPLIPVLRRGELEPILRQVRPDLIVVPKVWRGFDHQTMAEELASLTGARVWALELDGVIDSLTGGEAQALPAPPESAASQWVYSSSGSTAHPKTILHTDESVVASAGAQLVQFDLGPSDLFPISFPVSHIGGMASLVTSWVRGTQLMLDSTFDPTSSPQRMSRHGATVLGSATPFFLAFLAAQRLHGREPLFPGLRFCMGGGAPIPTGLHAQVIDELGGAGIFNGYGLTECPILGYPTPQSPPELIDASAFVPAPAVDIKILDPNGEQVPDGTQGELWTKGPQSLLGYLDPDLTASLIDDAGFVSTGDLAVRSGGHVRITGRLKDVIIRNGENISAIEVETALANLPDIAEVAVVGLPDPRSGERVCAVVVPTETDRPPTLEDLATACAEAGLAKFKTPEQIRIVGGLPRSPMGKLVKASILELIQDPNTHASPQSAQEKD